MIRFILILVSAMVYALPVSQGQNCTYQIPPEQFQIDGETLGVQPGETICLEAGNKDYLFIQNVHGSETNPVTIINKDGAVVINTDHFFGIKIAHCSFIRLLGNGTSGIDYGIQIQRVGNGAGISVGELSTNVEIAYTETAHTAIGGVYAKTDPTCNDFSSTRDKFTMYNFIFHNNYVHDTEDEGLYIGSSKYTGQYLPDCDTTVLPHVLEGTRIFDNIVENTGWDGIQVSSSETGCRIHDNKIRYDSQAEEYGQMSGILIGGGSRCKTYNNQIIDGKGDGIDIFGLGDFDIFNNLIVRAGADYHPGNPNDYKHGMYIGSAVTGENALLGVYNNTVVEPKSFGITVANADLFAVRVINNLITGPGQFPVVGSSAYINVNVPSGVVTSENNFERYLSGDVRFVDASGDNYDLKGNSPAVNYGQDLSSQGVSFDIMNRSRPFHTFFDAGAYESHDPHAGTPLYRSPDILSVKVMPNPFYNYFKIIVKSAKRMHLKVELITVSGQTVDQKILDLIPDVEGYLVFDTDKISSGTCFLKLTDRDYVKGLLVLQKR